VLLFVGRSRWVYYNDEKFGWDYDASQIPPDWWEYFVAVQLFSSSTFLCYISDLLGSCHTLVPYDVVCYGMAQYDVVQYDSKSPPVINDSVYNAVLSNDQLIANAAEVRVKTLKVQILDFFST